MKKNIRNLIGSLIFVGLALLISIPISYLLRPAGDGNFREIFTGFYAEEEDSLDVVVFGSSAVYRFINTPYLWEEFGITSYNLATGSQPTNVMPALIEEVQKTQSPKLYMVDIRQFLKEPGEENMDGAAEEGDVNTEVALRRVTDNMNYSWNRTKLVWENTKGKEDSLSYFLDILKYHGQWEEIFKNSQFVYADNEELHPLKGWSNIVDVEKLEQPEHSRDMEPLAIHENNMADLISLLDFCDEKQIDVLFISTPWEITENNVRRSKYIGELVTSRGYSFLDCNLHYQEMGLDFATDYYDRKHTNVWGSEKVTEFIGQYITSNYQVVGEHSEFTRREWDAVVQKNQEDIEKQLKKQLEEQAKEQSIQ